MEASQAIKAGATMRYGLIQRPSRYPLESSSFRWIRSHGHKLFWLRMTKTVKQHPDTDSLRRGMARCLEYVAPFSGIIYRAVATRYANRNDLLTGKGAKIYGGRWNPPGLFCVVYGTPDPHAALAETLNTYGQYGIPQEQRLPLVLAAINVRLQRVLDLTCGKIRSRLGVSEERMLEADWRTAQAKNSEGLTQAIGRLAREARIEALLVSSARLKKGENLVIFPDQLTKLSRLRIVNRRDLPECRS